MENEQVLNPNESLALISEVINKTKENIREHSFTYLLWGWAITFASFASFVLVRLGFELFFLPFPIISILAAIVNIWFYSKEKIKHTETYLSHFLSKMWLVVGGSFFVIVFISISQHITPFAFTIALSGIGTLLSGIIMRYRPLIFGGVLFFVCAVISVYLPLEYKILIQGFAIVFGNLIPGYMLKYSKS